jgi:uncharacterized protein YwgA
MLLVLLYSSGGKSDFNDPVSGRTRLMKLLFLLQNEYNLHKKLGIDEEYGFEAYNYGPFSKDVYDDVEFLENVGLIKTSTKGLAGPADQNEEMKVVNNLSVDYGLERPDVGYEEEVFELTKKGISFVEEQLLPSLPNSLYKEIIKTKERFSDLPLSSLLRYVYKKYPEAAEKTKLEHLKPN